MTRASAAPALEHVALSFLRPPIYGLTALALFYPLSAFGVTLAGAVGALLGAAAGGSLARSSLRLRAAVTGVGVLLLSLWAVRLLSLGSASLSAALGPASLLVWSAGGSLFAGAALVSAALRMAALRRRAVSLLEVGLVALAFAQLVVAHRQGAINRPFELTDSILAVGGDPSIAFLTIGALAAVLALLLLLDERRLGRALLNLGLAGLLLSLVLVSTNQLGLPGPPPGASGLGLRPTDKAQPQTQGKPRDAKDRTANEQLEFRDNYDSTGRQVPLAVVLLHDDYSPPSGQYYFRQAAFSQYNGRRLISATRGGVDADVAPPSVFGRVDIAKVPNRRGDRVELETTVALLADHTRPFALESPVTLAPAENPDPGRFRLVYRATSSAMVSRLDGLLGQVSIDPTWDEDVRTHYLQGPADPRYGALAAEILEAVSPSYRDDPVARAAAVTLWLSREGIYSLRSGHAKAEDPTADFLFGDRTGYCVHFAHAAVYLMRALGVPARVGTGYVVDEAARRGGSAILLTGANAHAWPELYVEGAGWVIADVAPERALDPPPPAPDPDLQRLLGEMARGLAPLPQGKDRPFEPMVAAAQDFTEARSWLARVGLPALLALLYAVKLWRRWAPYLAPAARLPRLAYRAQLDRLGELSVRRRYGESREHFARRVASSPAFTDLTAQHVAATFGAQTPPPRRQLLTLLAEARRELAQRTPLWRRLLGFLIPWSWLTTH